MEIELESTEKIAGDVQEVYQQILPIVNEMIGGRKLSAEMFRPIIIKLIQIIQELTEEKYKHMEGSQKKQIALSVLDFVIKDLKSNGKVNDDVADHILLALEFFGPALIDFAAAFVKKILVVAKDIKKKGCKGCFARNFK